MHKNIYAKFYNKALKEISLEEIKDYGLRPMGGGFWWLIPELIEGIAALAGEGAAAAVPVVETAAAAVPVVETAASATPSLISSVTPYLSAGSTAASLLGSDNSKASPPSAPKFGQSPPVQTPDIYGQTPTPYQNNFSANMLGDYSPQPKYGSQGGANPWQEQIMSQLLQQQDAQRSQIKPAGGEKK